MDTATLILRLVLAVVLGVAGVAKLVDRRGSEKAITDFGLPSSLAPALALLLPVAEIVAAMALLLRTTAWWGAAGALGLFAIFIAGITYNMARGRAPDCHCFGQLHSEPVGWPTLARNAVFAALSAVVLARGRFGVGPGAFDWAATLTTIGALALTATIVAAAAIGALTWFSAQLFAQQGRLLVRVDSLETRLAQVSARAPVEQSVAQTPTPPPVPQGLPVGAPAPAFTLPDLEGRATSLAELLRQGRPVLLLSMDPNCGPCTALLPDVARWQRELAGVEGSLTLAILSRGTPKENRKKFAEPGLPMVLLQEKYEVAERYSALGTPSAVVIRPGGRIGSALAPGADAIRALVAQTVSDATTRATEAKANGGRRTPLSTAGGGARAGGPSSLGTAAPALALRDLDGERVALQEFRGRDTLVLFWNTGCGFCQRMVPDLKTWEETAGGAPGAPQLLVVSTGGVEANRAMGLRSPIVLDDEFAAGRAFGAGGTPSAVLVDAAGRIASGVAVGATAVFSLAAPVEALLGD
jgi:peroxiredoxin/uncharacterized membrane protein YphA (DoxX/SURF4 family)